MCPHATLPLLLIPLQNGQSLARSANKGPKTGCSFQYFHHSVGAVGANSGAIATTAGNLLIVIKTRPNDWAVRALIRRTWGRRRTVTISGLTLVVASAFLIGQPVEERKRIRAEIQESDDIIWYNFLDSYFNNTLKMGLGFRWVSEHCYRDDDIGEQDEEKPSTLATVQPASTAQLILFADDDYYINVYNLARYIRSAGLLLGAEDESDDGAVPVGKLLRRRELSSLSSLTSLYAGRLLTDAPPQRSRGSVWRLSLAAYPYDRFPPYVNAGAYLMSSASVNAFWLASAYVRILPFDDVYAGIVAKKLGIEPQCAPGFLYHFYDPPFDPQLFRYVVAAHGFKDAVLLQRAYNAMEGFEASPAAEGLDFMGFWKSHPLSRTRGSCVTGVG